MSGSVSARSLARAACLSPDRFAHLFRAEAGVSVRRFILWPRLRRANKLVLGGASLTDAAHAAGFADSAHFSRSYRQVFGVSPSTLLANPDVKLIVTRD
ncbi:MAG: helix-turn-helix transcriptional regulator [Polyangiaceae bacterium]|nr:helix-turn-helix transcriptional regulator [Polyangiaceae bacterium]